MSNKETIAQHKDYLWKCVSHYYSEPIALARGEGMHVWDEDGQKYLDCFGGVLVTSIGHANSHVNEAVIDQVKTITHTSTLYASGPQAQLAAKLEQHALAVGLVLYGRSTMSAASLMPNRAVRSIQRDTKVLSERVAG